MIDDTFMILAHLHQVITLTPVFKGKRSSSTALHGLERGHLSREKYSLRAYLNIKNERIDIISVSLSSCLGNHLPRSISYLNPLLPPILSMDFLVVAAVIIKSNDVR